MASQRHHGSVTVCPAGRRAASCWGVGMASRCRWIGIPLRTRHQPSGHPQYWVGNERQTEDRARTRVSLARHVLPPAGAERAFPAGLRRARRSCIRDSASQEPSTPSQLRSRRRLTSSLGRNYRWS